jgi:tRNA threonylcarbamoyladenosine biosynthesis protein TsaE
MSIKVESTDPKRGGAGIILHVTSLQETKQVARIIGRLLTPGLLIGLTGELGVGKTEIAKEIALELGVFDEVSSPTYVLEFQYELSGRLQGNVLSHWDLYRVDNEEFCLELASSKLSKTSIGLIEWPQRVRGVNDLLDLQILITFCRSDEEQSTVPCNTRRRLEISVPEDSDIGEQVREQLFDDLKGKLAR